MPDYSPASALGASDIGTILSLLGADAIRGILSSGFANAPRMAATGLSPAGAIFTMLEYFKMGIGQNLARRLGFNLDADHPLRPRLDYWWTETNFFSEDSNLLQVCRKITSEDKDEKVTLLEEGRPSVSLWVLGTVIFSVLSAYSIPIAVTIRFLPDVAIRRSLVAAMAILAVSLAMLPLLSFYGQKLQVRGESKAPPGTRAMRYCRDWNLKAIGKVEVPENIGQNGAGLGLHLVWVSGFYRSSVVCFSVAGAACLVYLLSRMGSIAKSEVVWTWAVWFAATAIARGLAWFLSSKTEAEMRMGLILGLLEKKPTSSCETSPVTPFETFFDWCMGPDMSERGVLVQYNRAAVVSIAVGKEHHAVFCIAGVPSSLTECVFDIRDILFLLRHGDNPRIFLEGGQLFLPMQQMATTLQSRRVAIARLLLAYAASTPSTENFHLWQMVVYLVNAAGCRTALGFGFDRCIENKADLDTLLRPLYAVGKEKQAELAKSLLVSSCFATDYLCYEYSIRHKAVWVTSRINVSWLPSTTYETLGANGVRYPDIGVTVTSARSQCRIYREWVNDEAQTRLSESTGSPEKTATTSNLEITENGPLDQMVEQAGVCGNRGLFTVQSQTYTIAVTVPEDRIAQLPKLGDLPWDQSHQYPGICWFSDVPETARPRVADSAALPTILE